MTILIFAIFLIVIFYVLIIIALTAGVICVSVETKQNSTIQNDSVSIVVPFRNEEGNLNNFLNSVSGLDKKNKKLEIIFINDFSTDKGAEIISNYKNSSLSIKLLDLSVYTGKKAAQALGVKTASHNIIAFTDADCILPKEWLEEMLTFMDVKTQIVCGPVIYSETRKLSEKIFNIEFISLLLSGAGAFGMKMPVFCNGANLIVRKNALINVADKMAGKQLASGDDVFLLHAIIGKYGRNSAKFAFSQKCIVKTNAPGSLNEFVSQRIRWGAKTTAYKNTFALLLAVSVFVACSCILLLFLLSVFYKFFIIPAIICFGMKIIADFMLFTAGNKIYQNKYIPLLSIPLQFFYLPYVIIIGIVSLFVKVKWKERAV